MHEYALMDQVLSRVREEAAARSIPFRAVRALRLRVGALELHLPEAFRQAFRMQIAGAGLNNVELAVVVIPGRITCSHCGFDGPVPEDATDPHNACPAVSCPQCGSVCLVHGGRGIESIELDIEEPAANSSLS